jgi:hypothetical protein
METKGLIKCSQEPAYSIQSKPTHPVSDLILSSRLSLFLQSGIFLSGIPTKMLYVFLISVMRATCPADSFSLIWLFQ